jgi:hypothetical protein
MHGENYLIKVYRVLVGKSSWKEIMWKKRHIQGNNIGMDFGEIFFEDVT